ncbi:SIS domain-containing protein [Shewanella surugensis]|uniref:SIS domain-containing protein n=1 Tax=Shewanella surugensis TaxID=212020 RepID=A0ABT0LL53_9GAMM|nr:SIS domain-containing protein [Shewanella surugensis]MCL1128022.1 SIS domain-containing protein [Shewanella surugensis]
MDVNSNGLNFSEWQKNIAQGHAKLVVSNRRGIKISVDLAFNQLRQIIYKLHSKNGSAYFIGNGASSTIASHFAADLTNNYAVHATAISDPALLTAQVNDFGSETMFSRPLNVFARENDLLIAISSSGSSSNILSGVRCAHEKGMMVVTFSAMSQKNPLRNFGDLNFYVPVDTYGVAETCHTSLLHYWLDSMNPNFFLCHKKIVNNSSDCFS